MLAMPGKFVTSIAVQLANNMPALKRNICDAITERGDIVSQSLRDQWRHLVLGPLSKHSGKDYRSSHVFVVDELDECDDDNNIGIILQLLAEAQPETHRAGAGTRRWLAGCREHRKSSPERR